MKPVDFIDMTDCLEAIRGFRLHFDATPGHARPLTWHQAFSAQATDDKFYRLQMTSPANVRGASEYALVKMSLGPSAAQFLCEYAEDVWEWT
jgi:hypothetical protein